MGVNGLSGITQFYEAIKDLQSSVIESQMDVLTKIAEVMANTILNDGSIFLFGTGHSSILPQEGNFRAGGLAPVIPILRTNLMLHENALLSGAIERIQGLAPTILESYNPKSTDMIFVISNSGVNNMPVEMALTAKKIGLVTVAICSFKYAKVAPLSSIGKRLYEIVDYALDNGGEPGDAIIPLNTLQWKVGSTSTIISSLIWQCLITETALLIEKKNKNVPVFASFNMPGADDHNKELLLKWRIRNPHV